MPVWEDTD